MQEKKKWETSKLLLAAVFVLVALFCTAALVIGVTDEDPTVRMTVFTGFFALPTVVVPVACSAYSRKAQAENVIKLQSALDAQREKSAPKSRKKSAAEIPPELLQNAVQQAIAGWMEANGAG